METPQALLILLVIAIAYVVVSRFFNRKQGYRTGKLQGFPYAVHDHFLSPAELSFFRVLRETVGDRAVLCTKVNLSDVFWVKTEAKSNFLAYRNKIDRKHVDFLLCDVATMQPIVAIELDDKSHERKDRQERDAFVDLVFNAAKLPLLHIPVRQTYTITALAEQLHPYLRTTSQARTSTVAKALATPSLQDAKTPHCPKCGSAMTLRVARTGANAGNKFWGCSNYPTCRGMISIPQI